MAQSVLANNGPRYHKTDDPLADLAAITGYRGGDATRSVDDIAVDLEAELLGAFGAEETAADALDAELEARFDDEFSAASPADLALSSEFDAAFEAGLADHANSNDASADAAWDDGAFGAEWEIEPLEDAGHDAEDVAALPAAAPALTLPADAAAMVDLDFADFDATDFEPAFIETEHAAETDFEAELLAQMDAAAAYAEPAATLAEQAYAPPVQTAHSAVIAEVPKAADFETEMNAALGAAAAPSGEQALTPKDPFAELAALAASYKAGRPSVFSRAPSWTARTTAPAAAPIAPQDRIQVAETPPPLAADDFGMDEIEQVADFVPVTDEFDLPELDFETPPDAGEIDDFGVDEASAYAEPAAAENVKDDQFEAIGNDFSDFFGAELERIGQQGGAGAQALEPAAPEAFDSYARHQEDMPARAPGGRGFAVAAGVAALALIGGLGAFAFMGGERTPSQPAVIKADSEPVKIKPANPGGAEIANQDKAVYDKVAGAEANAAPAQKSLVTTAEEPVDVVAAAKERAPAAKAEDRVAVQPDEPAANPVTSAIQPKKVRTLIVKPDGTLVTRESPAAAPAATAAAQPAVLPAANEPAAVSYQPPVGAATDPAALPGADEEMAAADPVQAAIAETTEVAAPASPVEKAAAPVEKPKKKAAEAKKAETKKQAKAEQVAAVEPAAGGGGWSIQIASQPTKEGAQASYKSLSGKFGSILGGRGVSIVQAEIAGKGTFYRVRVPAGSKADANELCARYQSAGGSCFITR